MEQYQVLGHPVPGRKNPVGAKGGDVISTYGYLFSWKWQFKKKKIPFDSKNVPKTFFLFMILCDFVFFLSKMLVKSGLQGPKWLLRVV